MADTKLTGIYFQSAIKGNEDTVNFTEVAAYIKKYNNVAAIWNADEVSLADANNVAAKIKEKNIKRFVIAGDKPGMEKSFFTKAMVNAGNKAEDVIIASFREHGAIRNADTNRAKAILACAVNAVPFEEATQTAEVPVNPNTLVIGGGIAGIQASLEIADAGQKVFLVEKTGTIGGHMAMFDKTFPTLDCAACILTPKMVEIGQHSNIELMTYCEVKDVKGTPGNFTVKILKKARRVDLKTCIGCGTCTEKCPGTAPSEFDAGTAMRKAIYIPFPQAVPNKYLIDGESCTYVKSGKCKVCVKVCPVPDCINLDEKDEEVEINVGNIIVATGFKIFDAKRAEQFGYGKLPNVVTSLEFERLVNAAGPTGGNIVYRSQDKRNNWVFKGDADIPKSVAIIHCIGSRDENYNKYCSKVCCMYSLKLAHLVVEKLPDAKVFEYFIDMRAFGKGYEEFYERIKHEGVSIIRGRTAKIEEKNNKLMLRGEDILGNKLIEQEIDMAILAVGLEPREDSANLSKMLGISQTEDGWFMEANYISNPVNTFTGGISIAGVCQGPKDIPDTVAQASAAASRVLQNIVRGKINKSVKDLSLEEIESQVNKLA
ncbi:MAG: CoB--CoM heterodisulfide reductase iron-sulfur subunit A family protein [Bacteroidales bacterium]|nr:CoB--CoM heterodisulfide reductase iron-sulfur subunit A family protein [Bacteroidales bacterium]